MAVSPDTPISPADIQALFDAANSKSQLANGPFVPSGTPFVQWPGNIPFWQPGSYANNVQVIHWGIVWLNTVANNTTEPGSPGGWARLPLVNFGPWQGIFNSTTQTWNSPAYSIWTMVGYNGSNWISVTGIDANSPPPQDPVTGDVNPGWQQPWWSCYNRLREVVQAAYQHFYGDNGLGATTNASVSGPWPVGNLPPPLNCTDLEFYYEDTGKTESVTINLSSGIIVSRGVFSTAVATFSYSATPDSSGNFTNNIQVFATHAEYEVFIGGNFDANLSGSFQIFGRVFPGQTVLKVTGQPDVITPDLTDASGLVTVSGNFPGTLSKTNDNQGGPVVNILFTVNQKISPGTYKIILDINQAMNDTEVVNVSGGITTDTKTTHTRVDFSPVSGAPAGGQMTGFNLNFNITYSGADEVPGIDSKKRVMKIKLPLPGQFDFIAGVMVPDTNRAGLLNNLIAGVILDANGQNSINSLDPSRQYIAYPTDERGQPLNMFVSWTCGGFGIGPGVFTPRSNLMTFQGNSDAGPHATQGLSVGELYYSGWDNYVRPVYPRVPPQPTFGNAIITPAAGISISTSVPGLWKAKTPPINDLHMRLQAQMPWNILQDDNGNNPNEQTGGFSAIAPPRQLNMPYTVTGPFEPNGFFAYFPAFNLGLDSIVPFETQLQPMPWRSNLAINPTNNEWLDNTWWPMGWQIQDSNGNLQTVITPGMSDVSPPGSAFSNTVNKWGTSVNQITHDGGVGWICTRVNNKKTSDTWPPVPPKIGMTVIDRNGNTQTIVSGWKQQFFPLNFKISDSNGNGQQVIQAGVSGATEPVWSAALNGQTTDGGVIWKCIAVGNYLAVGTSEPLWKTGLNQITRDGTIFWKLTSVNGIPLTPGMARMFSTPKYPVFWQTANPNPKNPAVFNPVGWWIYRIYVNRLGQKNAAGIVVPTPGSIPVTIGCMRNGAFAPFGTYQTGTAQTVLWPIFTNDPLVYQASEQVDIQASIIGGGVGVWGPALTYPISAALYNDMIAVLGLFS